MHAGLERRRPGRGVHRRAPVPAARERLPVDEERDRILGLWHAVVRLAGGDARRRARYNPRRDGFALHDPAVDIDVMRGKVIAGFRMLSCTIQIELWMTRTHLISESLPAHARNVSS